MKRYWSFQCTVGDHVIHECFRKGLGNEMLRVFFILDVRPTFAAFLDCFVIWDLKSCYHFKNWYQKHACWTRWFQWLLDYKTYRVNVLYSTASPSKSSKFPVSFWLCLFGDHSLYWTCAGFHRSNVLKSISSNPAHRNLIFKSPYTGYKHELAEVMARDDFREIFQYPNGYAGLKICS